MIEYFKLTHDEECLVVREVNRVPNIKSAIKRVKTSEKRRARNQSQKSALRTAIKAAENAIAAADLEAAKAAVAFASKKLDKAVTKGLIHKNKAARKKSRLAHKLNALLAQQA
jgi:small subunit ribosomal protein S20